MPTDILKQKELPEMEIDQQEKLLQELPEKEKPESKAYTDRSFTYKKRTFLFRRENVGLPIGYEGTVVTAAEVCEDENLQKLLVEMYDKEETIFISEKI